MIKCNELTGKVIEQCTIYDQSEYGPEVRLQFADGTEFSASLKMVSNIEAKFTRDEGGEPVVLRDYSLS